MASGSGQSKHSSEGHEDENTMASGSGQSKHSSEGPEDEYIEVECCSSNNMEQDLHSHFKLCKKNPGHSGFIPIKDLKEQHLPAKWQDPFLVKYLKGVANYTVRVVVNYTSPRRPNSYVHATYKGSKVTRLGTGRIQQRLTSGPLQPCPIVNCPVSKEPHLVTETFPVFTATHVVYDDSEAKETIVEFCYDSDEDRDRTVLTAQGIDIKQAGIKSDSSGVLCVSHDIFLFENLINRLCSWNPLLNPLPIPRGRKPLVVIISHPHGCPKHISFGELVGFTEDQKLASKFDMKVADFVQIVQNEDVFLQEGGINTDAGFLSSAHIQNLVEACNKNPDMMASQLGTKTDKLNLSSIHYTAATCSGSSGAQVLVLTNFISCFGDLSRAVFTFHSSHSAKLKVNISGKVYSGHSDQDLLKHLNVLRREQKKRKLCPTRRSLRLIKKAKQ